MKFMEILEKQFSSLELYTNAENYKITPRAFTMDGKWEFLDYVLFILANKGKSLTLEIENFVETHFNDDEDKLITKEAVSKQRQKFSYEIFIDMNKEFITEFYKSEEYKQHIKDKIVVIIDGSKSNAVRLRKFIPC